MEIRSELFCKYCGNLLNTINQLLAEEILAQQTLRLSNELSPDFKNRVITEAKKEIKKLHEHHDKCMSMLAEDYEYTDRIRIIEKLSSVIIDINEMHMAEIEKEFL